MRDLSFGDPFFFLVCLLAIRSLVVGAKYYFGMQVVAIYSLRDPHFVLAVWKIWLSDIYSILFIIVWNGKYEFERLTTSIILDVVSF